MRLGKASQSGTVFKIWGGGTPFGACLEKHQSEDRFQNFEQMMVSFS